MASANLDLMRSPPTAFVASSSALVTRCDGERSVLDRIEGHRTTSDPENYAKICVTVDLGGQSRTAWTYIGLNDAIKRCETKHPGSTCDSDYGATVIPGARSIGAPEDYLEELRARSVPLEAE